MENNSDTLPRASADTQLTAGVADTLTPTAAKPPASEVGNKAFLAAINRNVPDGARTVICAIEGDPQQKAAWTPRPAESVGTVCLPSTNNYFNCSSFYPGDDGTVKARATQSAACHIIVLDDIGTKVRWGLVNGLWPSSVIETSPGNHQVGLIFEPPLSPEVANDVVAVLIKAGMSDPGATSPATRWMRLPVGVNGKAKYAIDGQPFTCKLIEWNPERTFTPEDIYRHCGFGPSPRPTIGRLDDAGGTAAPPGGRLEDVTALLGGIDPDCSYVDWLRVLMAVHHESGGSQEGFDIVDAWSSKGSKYDGQRVLQQKWKSFKASDKPVTIGTLMKLAKENGHECAELLAGPGFEVCDDPPAIPQPPAPPSAVIADPPATPSEARTDPLVRFSLRGQSSELERKAASEKPFAGEIALAGQATVVYAKPNTGKTLITLRLLTDGARRGAFDPDRLFYLNMDDSSRGLAEKVAIAEEYGFHMLSDGYQDFSARAFRQELLERSLSRGAPQPIVVLDTLKKFVDTMDKSRSSEFNQLVRSLVLSGGTVLALSHANKVMGKDGRPVPSGTSDVIDDFDCAYILYEAGSKTDTEKVVLFENLKRRGNVPHLAGYQYAYKGDMSYAERLASVQPIDAELLVPIQQEFRALSDAQVVAAIQACLHEGVTKKMSIADAVREKAKVTRQQAIQVLEKYQGDDPSIHRWNYVVRGRGAKVYTLLNPIDAIFVPDSGIVLNEPDPQF